MNLHADHVLPNWFTGLLGQYADVSQPSLKEALRRYAASLPDPSVAPQYWQARQALSQFQAQFMGCSADA